MTNDEGLRAEAYAAADHIIAEHGWPWVVQGGNVVASTDRARDFLALAFAGGVGYGSRMIGDRIDAALAELGQGLETGGSDAAA